MADWCAFDPNAYDLQARKLAAACAVLPQHEAYWMPENLDKPTVVQFPLSFKVYKMAINSVKN